MTLTENPMVFVDDLINRHKIVLFSKSYCPFSLLAKNILKHLQFKNVEIVDYDQFKQWKDIQDYLVNIYDSNLPAPRVFLNGKCIGGGVEILFGDNQLNRTLIEESLNEKKENAKKYVDLLLKIHKVVMFSKSYDTFSDVAKSVLNRYQIEDLKICELDQIENCSEIKDYIASICDDNRTIPRIFLNGKCIAGGLDLNKMNTQGKLIPMLREGGVKMNEEIANKHELAQNSECSMEFAKQFVDNLINNHKVVVFSKTYCPFCILGKNVLGLYNIKDIKTVEIEDMPECNQIQEYLGTLCNGESTVPRVFVERKFIGGGSEMEKFHNSGKLKEMLKL
ncbi:hypothetical protein ACOME3_007248 [Neoechinorhynchus agilis]